MSRGGSGQGQGQKGGRSGGSASSSGGSRAGGAEGSTNLGKEFGGAARRDAHSEEPGPRTRGEGDWGKVYAPKKLAGDRYEDLFSKRHLGKGPMLSRKLIRGRPDAQDSATVPYQEALPAYRDGFEKAMNEGAIPAEYRDPVKKYFEKLK